MTRQQNFVIIFEIQDKLHLKVLNGDISGLKKRFVFLLQQPEIYSVWMHRIWDRLQFISSNYNLNVSSNLIEFPEALSKIKDRFTLIDSERESECNTVLVKCVIVSPFNCAKYFFYKVLFMGQLIPLFWTSGDVCPSALCFKTRVDSFLHVFLHG